MQELEGLDDAALRDLYEMRADEQRAAAGREDFSGALGVHRWIWAAEGLGCRWYAVLKAVAKLLTVSLCCASLVTADMVAAKAAQQKRKAAEKAGGKEKKYKF